MAREVVLWKRANQSHTSIGKAGHDMAISELSGAAVTSGLGVAPSRTTGERDGDAQRAIRDALQTLGPHADSSPVLGAIHDTLRGLAGADFNPDDADRRSQVDGGGGVASVLGGSGEGDDGSTVLAQSERRQEIRQRQGGNRTDGQVRLQKAMLEIDAARRETPADDPRQAHIAKSEQVVAAEYAAQCGGGLAREVAKRERGEVTPW